MTGRQGSWHARQWVETHAKIVVAAEEVRRRRGRPLKLKDLAEAAGVSPRTVLRHFPVPDDAMMINGTTVFIDKFVTAVTARPPEQNSLQAVVLTAVEEAANNFGMAEDDIRRVARSLTESEDNWLVAADSWVRHTAPAVLTALAARAGRTQPSLEDRLAVNLTISLGLTAWRVWAEEGFTRPLQDLYLEAAALIGIKFEGTS